MIQYKVMRKIFLPVLLTLLVVPNVMAENSDDVVIPSMLEGIKREETATPTPIPTVTKSPLDKVLEKNVKAMGVDAIPEKAEDSGEFPKNIDRYTVTPVSDYKFNLLLESVAEKTKLDLPLDVTLYDGAPWSTWKKDTFFIDADLEEFQIRFQYSGDDLPQEKPKGYYISIKFEEERSLGEQMTSLSEVDPDENYGKKDNVIIKHSLPKRDLERNGIRLMLNKQQQRVLLEGRDDTSMVVIVPESIQRNSREIILCPRDYDIWKLRSGDKRLHNTGYEMVSVESKARGKAQIGVRSGLGAGLAKIHILTSENILPAKFSYDEALMQRPVVSLEYKPSGIKNITAENTETLSSGIIIQTVHHNDLNQKTVTTGEVKMTIKKVETKDTLPLQYYRSDVDRRMQKAINFKVEPGICYAIIKQRTLTHKFVKEKFPKKEK